MAYVVHTFDMGGIERCVARLVNHLDRSRFRPLVVCLNRSGAAADWVDVDDVPIISLHKRRGNDPRVVPRLARVLREQQVTLVHSHNWGTLIESVLARKLARVPRHLHAEHGAELEDLQIRRAKRWLRSAAGRWALGRVDRVVTVAQSLRQKLATRCGYSASSLTLIPNGVDDPEMHARPSQVDSIRAELRIPPAATIVGSVGRFAAVKDLGAAIDAIGQLRRRGHDVHLMLVGDGSQRESLRHKAVSIKVAEQVHFVGQQENINPWLSAMDIYVNCSLSEGMSLGILEALAAAIPCVVTDVGDNAVLIGGAGPCGVVVPPGSPTRLAAAIEDLLHHRGERLRFGHAARRRYEQRYSVRTMVEQYEHLYLGLCDRENAPNRQGPR